MLFWNLVKKLEYIMKSDYEVYIRVIERKVIHTLYSNLVMDINLCHYDLWLANICMILKYILRFFYTENFHNQYLNPYIFEFLPILFRNYSHSKVIFEYIISGASHKDKRLILIHDFFFCFRSNQK